MSFEELVDVCVCQMWSQDIVLQVFGMVFDGVGFGWFKILMMVMDKMVNGYGICYGGYLFMLVDSVFVFVCNIYNQIMVVQQCLVIFLVLVYVGDCLIVVVWEIFCSGCFGFYDVIIINQNGDKIVEFCGNL